MKIYSMEFLVNGVVTYSTEPYVLPVAVLSEAYERQRHILDRIACHSKDILFDSQYADDSPENEDSVRRFGEWMLRFHNRRGSLDKENLLSVQDGDVSVHFRGQEVRFQFRPA